MITITARNVNDAYQQGLTLLSNRGREAESRVGPVLRLDSPVTTIYNHPRERLLFDDARDANPFFHLFESLWMLNGSNDLETLTHFVRTFDQFSDDGHTLHGAYGFRWRHAGVEEDIDQLVGAINLLSENPNDRRVVIQMWDVNLDLGVNSKDIPCNDMIKCSITDGVLDLIVFCRSNDIIYGAYGANAVHLSMLHEYLASMIGCLVGRYFQISCDYHAYLETPYQFSKYVAGCDLLAPEPYSADRYAIIPLITEPATFDRELELFMNAVRQWTELTPFDIRRYTNDFFHRVAQPMYMAYFRHKRGETHDAWNTLVDQEPIDWLAAGRRWLARRM